MVKAGIKSYKIRRRILDGIRDAYNEYIKPGLPLNAAIGQGEDRFTPLQMAVYAAAIGNGGIRYRPHLVKRIVSIDGETVQEIKPERMGNIKLKPKTLPVIIKGMDAVTGEQGGTARAAFRGFNTKVAGKTGTAQASGGRDPYSWFVGFAPADKPEIAIAVVIHEGGGLGASNAARDILEGYFNLKKGRPSN
jgi:penicillin-binding protein 2